MVTKEKQTVSPGLNASASTTRLWHAAEKIREFDRRVLALTKDFNEFAGSGKNSIQRSDVTAFLEKLGTYDMHKVELVFEELDENKDDFITKNEYIRKCLEIEDTMVSKINQKIAALNAFKNQHEETIQKLSIAKETETPNRYGVMENSTFRIAIIEAKDFPSRFVPYTVVVVGDQDPSSDLERRAHVVFLNNGNKNDSDILTGEELIRITVMGKEIIGPNSFHGFTTIALNDIKDQLIHDVWLDLADLDGRGLPGKIHVKLQWIHSKITFYADLLERTQAKINAETIEKQVLEVDLEKLRCIFVGLEHKLVPHGVIHCIDLVKYHELTSKKEEKFISPTINRSVLLMQSPKPVIEPPEEFFTTENSLWLSLVLGAVLSCTFRLDFANICMGVTGLLLSMFKSQEQSRRQHRKLILGLYAATGYDFLWLVLTGYNAVLRATFTSFLGLLLYLLTVGVKLWLVKHYKDLVTSTGLELFMTPPAVDTRGRR